MSPAIHISNIPKKPIIIGGVLLVIVGLFFVIRANPNPQGTGINAEITVWGVLPTLEVKSLIKAHEAIEPGVKINYLEIAPENYEQTLLNALAADKGPDIFMIRNRSLPKQIDKIAPAGPDMIDITRLRALFPAVVENDFAQWQQVYALPLYLDTLSMIYNKNLFDQALVIQPPATWQEFQNFVPQLRALSPTRQIVKAAAAIGGSEKSITTAVDLLNLLMIQNGAPMVKPDRSAVDFASGEEGGAGTGLAAFLFYVQFANAGSPYYTWNDNQENFIESFAAGKTAIVFGYEDTIKKIKEKAPFLNFGVSPMLQPAGTSNVVNYPDYWGLAASRKSRLPQIAWKFILFTATDLGAQRGYLAASGRPPALRTLIGERLNDPDLGIFAKQAITARSWYQIDDSKVREIFSRGVSRVLTGQASSEKALDEIRTQINVLMRGTS